LTSINRAFDDLLGQVWGPRWEDKDGDVVGMVDRKGKLREKVVVYTKRDLAEEKYEQVRVCSSGTALWHWIHPTMGIGTDSPATHQGFQG
jgi:hypothetical protein